MYQSLKKRLKIEIEEIKDSGRYKNERIITSPQKAIINANEDEVVNFCANNYLGLASDERIIDAAKQSLDTHGFGLASRMLELLYFQLAQDSSQLQQCLGY